MLYVNRKFQNLQVQWEHIMNAVAQLIPNTLENINRLAVIMLSTIHHIELY
jgi:hypothetical protein